MIKKLLLVGANFPQARVRRKEGVGGRNSAAPERNGQEFFSKWVRAKFRMVGVPRVELGLTAPKAVVLPAYSTPKWRIISKLYIKKAHLTMGGS